MYFILFLYFIALKEEVAWNLLRPVCRALDELVNLDKVKFLSGFHSEKKAQIKFILSTVKFTSPQEVSDKTGDTEYQTINYE